MLDRRSIPLHNAQKAGSASYLNRLNQTGGIALRHPNFSEANILTILNAEDEAIQARLSKAAAAHVSITGGSASADTSLRIQAVLDLQGERLLFSLLDMQEGGAAGAAVTVPQNGEYILPGFAGSAVASVEITVNSYAALWEMVRNDYGGRLVDVLKIETA